MAVDRDELSDTNISMAVASICSGTGTSVSANAHGAALVQSILSRRISTVLELLRLFGLAWVIKELGGVHSQF